MDRIDRKILNIEVIARTRCRMCRTPFADPREKPRGMSAFATLRGTPDPTFRIGCRFVLGKAEPLRHNRPMLERPPRAPRAEPREVAELKQLKTDQPELASAVDMQLALVEMQR